MPWRLIEIQEGLPYGYFDRIKEEQDAREGRVTRKPLDSAPEGHEKHPGGTHSLGDAPRAVGDRLSPAEHLNPTPASKTG